MLKAAMINLISKYSVVIVQLILNFILARLISPQEFGIVAIITVFTSFFSIFSDMGIGTAVVQYKNLTKEEYQDLYSFSHYLSIILSFVFVGVGYIVSIFYNNSIYIKLGLILGVSIFFTTLSVVPSAIMLKEQRFLEIGLRTLLSAVISGSITIILAFCGFSYYAVVLQSLLQSLFVFIWNRLRVPLKAKLKFNLNSLKKIFSFSIYQAMFQTINYFAANTDTILVGKTLGEASVGLYDKAYKLMTYPMTMFSGIIVPVLHPILSNYQNNKEKMYQYLIQIYRILFYFAIIVSSICFFAPKEIIYILYGSKWNMATTTFRILSLSIITKMCNSITGAFFQSLGKTKNLFKTGCISTIIIVGFTFIGVFGGSIESVATFVSIGYFFNFFIAYYFLITEGFHKSFREFLKITWKPYFIYIILIFTTFFVSIPNVNVFLSLFIKGMITIMIYVLLILLLNEWNNFKNVYSILRKRNRK